MPTALVVEEKPIASMLLSSRGLRTEVYHQRQVTTSCMQEVTLNIKQDKYTMIWLELPAVNRGFIAKKRSKAIREYSTWLRNAYQVRVPAIIIGMRGRHWVDESLSTLLYDKLAFEQELALCRFGITIKPELVGPSDNKFHSYTSFPAPNFSCQCPAGARHTYELDKELKGRGALKDQAARKLYGFIMDKLFNGICSATLEPRLRGKPDFAASNQVLDVGMVANIKDTTNQDPLESHAFPTDAKEREKERKKANPDYKAKKQQKFVENHYDDLGDDLSGLGGDLEYLMAPVVREVCEAESSQESSDEEAVKGLTYWCFIGPDGKREIPRQVLHVCDLAAASQLLSEVGPGVDMCEFCGGVGRASTIAIRRRLRTGKNFDLVTNADLGDPTQQRIAMRYLDQHEVQVLVMGPSCRTLGPPSNVNMAINYDTWLRHYNEDMPHVRFCGRAALHQLRKGRHFLLEHPFPSWLTHEEPWPDVFNHARVMAKIIHQCMVGQHGADFRPAKKPSMVVASDEALLKPFEGLKCDGEHGHTQTWGAPGGIGSLQIWTWNFAERVVQGIVNLKSKIRRTRKAAAALQEELYPEMASGSADPHADPPAAASAVAPAADQWRAGIDFSNPWHKCIGCRGRMARTRREHSRIRGECKFPDVEPETEWSCPGCTRTPPRPRGHESHTDVVGECRWAVAPTRTELGRQGRHPREARRRGAAHPAADLRGEELTPSTDTAPADGHPDPAAVRAVLTKAIAATPAAASAAAPAAAPVPRGPRTPRVQVVDRASGGSSDWTSFDMSKSLRMLRTGNPSDISRQLRKLHLRWWHATRRQMEKILGCAGVPTPVLQQIPGIIDTCRECRVWMSASPDPTPTVDLIVKQNEQVEADIMFYRSFMAWHMLDRADRWHQGIQILSKASESLQEAIDDCWLRILGPFKFLVIDGEKGIMAQDTEEFLKRKGITVRTRAPGQHARMIERRGAILRHAMHCIEQQLESEGIQISFKTLLSEAVFSGNALLNYGGASPYNARLGTQPAMLPDIDAPPNDTAAGPGRYMHRVREIALQKIIETTALERIHRAMRTHTTSASAAMDLKEGELVDFHRPPARKDESGWRGPAKIIKNLPARGQAVVRWLSNDIVVRYPDIRKYMDFNCFVYGTFCPSRAIDIIESHLSTCTPGIITTLGYVRVGNAWQKAKGHEQLALAMEHFARVSLCFPDVYQARLGRAVPKFPNAVEAHHYVVLAWTTDISKAVQFESDGGNQCTTPKLIGPEWPCYKYIQLLMIGPGDEGDKKPLADLLEPEEQADAHETVSNDRLSTIEEGDEPDEESALWAELDDTISQYMQDCEDDNMPLDYYEARLPAPNGQELTVAESSRVADHSRACGSRSVDGEAPVSTAIRHLDMWTSSGSADRRVLEVEVHPGYHYLVSGADISLQDSVEEYDEDGNPHVDMLFPGETAKLIMDEAPPPGHCARLRCYIAHGKKAVIDRDTDLLTAQEYQENKKAVSAAVLEELNVWIKHGCFHRRPRKGAYNVLDVKWVGKWKWVKATLRPGDTPNQPRKVRIVRMRMTLRGFKDREAEGLETYAGTSSRPAQRIIVSEAVVRRWPLTTIDIRKAFLKGLTYKELAETTQEPAREVNFELAADAVAVLRMCKGYEDFDHRTEVLHMDKPGTGCKDAPRCFSLKLNRATNDIFGARPLTHDDQFIVRHRSRDLDFIGTKHVDDLKVGCCEEILTEFIRVLEQVFGKGELDITTLNFTNCGVRHIQLLDDWGVQDGYSLDQEEYITALRPIDTSELVGIEPATLVSSRTAGLFISLLMALAYTLLTRLDLCVYVTALQRFAQKPQAQHVKRLNVLVRWAQRHPLRIVYKQMQCAKRILGESDAGFRKEQDEDGHLNGRSSRGVNYLRLGQRLNGSSIRVHLIDWMQGAIKQVTRSTFTSEAHGIIGTIDHGIVLKIMLHEIAEGPLPISTARAMSESDYGSVTLEVATDAYNVVLALSGDRVKPPAEKSFLCHLLWIRDKLVQGALERLVWKDTRDITADPHTKGSAPRVPLHALASGQLIQQHAAAELMLRGTSKGLHQLTPSGRRMTPGEEAQCGRGVLTSADESGDGPQQATARNPWSCLGYKGSIESVRNLTSSQIETLYRRKAVELHPDKQPASQKAEADEAFRELTAAKEQLLDCLRRDDLGRLLALARRWLEPEDKSASDRESIAPGLVLLQGHLSGALRQRATSSMMSREGRQVAMRSQKLLHGIRGKAHHLKPGDKASKAKLQEARASIGRRANKDRIQKKLDRVLRAASIRRASGEAAPSTKAVRRSARGWLRTANHRMASTLKPRDKPPETVNICEVWRRYRREGAEWIPPSQPAPHRYIESASKRRARRRLRTKIRGKTFLRLTDGEPAGQGAPARKRRTHNRRPRLSGNYNKGSDDTFKVVDHDCTYTCDYNDEEEEEPVEAPPLMQARAKARPAAATATTTSPSLMQSKAKARPRPRPSCAPSASPSAAPVEQQRQASAPTTVKRLAAREPPPWRR